MRVKNRGEAPPGELIGRTTVRVECPETVAHSFAVAREHPKPQECLSIFARKCTTLNVPGTFVNFRPNDDTGRGRRRPGPAAPRVW
jgi:hypothetical protein